VSDDSELNGTDLAASEEGVAPVAAAPPPAPDRPAGDVLSTTPGKVALLVAAVLVLLAVAGVVGWFVLGPAALGGATGTPATTLVAPSTGTPAMPSAPSSTVATLAVADVTLRDVFTPRNPFTVIEPEKIEHSTSTATEVDLSDLDPDVVTLIDIVTVDGERQAVIAYGGVLETAASGPSQGRLLRLRARAGIPRARWYDESSRRTRIWGLTWSTGPQGSRTAGRSWPWCRACPPASRWPRMQLTGISSAGRPATAAEAAWTSRPTGL
jgi:hypothetical protein